MHVQMRACVCVCVCSICAWLPSPPSLVSCLYFCPSRLTRRLSLLPCSCINVYGVCDAPVYGVCACACACVCVCVCVCVDRLTILTRQITSSTSSMHSREQRLCHVWPRQQGCRCAARPRRTLRPSCTAHGQTLCTAHTLSGCTPYAKGTNK